MVSFVEIRGRRIEVERIPGGADGRTLIFLHEGLGSVAMWRDFPARLAAATGAAAVVYSRLGYGRSSPLEGPRTSDYMHEEALEWLPALREALGLAEPILVGHSDGASIALIHAGAGRWPVQALILEAPHVFTEEIGVRSIAAAKRAFETGDLKARLQRYHDDVEGAFRGWNDAWLAPEFLRWDIREFLPRIACPVLAIQGANDEYGTLAHLDAIAAGVRGPCERLVLPHAGHAPHRDAPDAVLAAMAAFVARVG